MIQLAAFLFSISVGFLSYKKKSISKSGLIALLSICALFILSNRIDLLTILFAMFASSSLLSLVGKEHKTGIEKIIFKSGPRDYFQAICNLGTAVLLFILGQTIHEGFIVGLLCSVACANADSSAPVYNLLPFILSNENLSSNFFNDG